MPQPKRRRLSETVGLTWDRRREQGFVLHHFRTPRQRPHSSSNDLDVSLLFQRPPMLAVLPHGHVFKYKGRPLKRVSSSSGDGIERCRSFHLHEGQEWIVLKRMWKLYNATEEKDFIIIARKSSITHLLENMVRALC